MKETVGTLFFRMRPKIFLGRTVLNYGGSPKSVIFVKVGAQSVTSGKKGLNFSHASNCIQADTATAIQVSQSFPQASSDSKNPSVNPRRHGTTN